MIELLTLPGWLTSEKDVTLATWGLVLATIIVALITFSGIAWSMYDRKKRDEEQRTKWQREDEKARIRERNELLNNLIEQFNSPPLLITRAELAYQLIGESRTSIPGIEREPALKFRLPNKTPPQAWAIADFLERLARRWRDDSLDTDLIDFRLGDYLLIFANQFELFLENEAFSNKYAAWKKLNQELRTRREHASEVPGVDILAAGYDKARAIFWYSEYKLFRLFPGELPPLLSKSRVTQQTTDEGR